MNDIQAQAHAARKRLKKLRIDLTFVEADIEALLWEETLDLNEAKNTTRDLCRLAMEAHEAIEEFWEGELK